MPAGRSTQIVSRSGYLDVRAAAYTIRRAEDRTTVISANVFASFVNDANTKSAGKGCVLGRVFFRSIVYSFAYEITY